jgi:hypothetical protein
VTAKKKAVAHGSRRFAHIALRSMAPVRAPGGLRRALLAALAGLLLMSSWPSPAIAQSCRTPQVEARIDDLRQRIERYRDRINQANAELSKERLQYENLKAENPSGPRTQAAFVKWSRREGAIQHLEGTLQVLIRELARLTSLPACPRPGSSVSAVPRSSSEAAALAKALPGGLCPGASPGSEPRKRDPDAGVVLNMIRECYGTNSFGYQ